MNKLNCKQLVSAISEVKSKKDKFDHFLKLDDFAELNILQAEINKTIEGLFEILDPHCLIQRQQIAKDLRYGYVGPIYDGKVAFGIRFFGMCAPIDRRVESQLIDLKTKKPIGKKYGVVSSFHDGSAMVERSNVMSGSSSEFLVNARGHELYSVTEGYTSTVETKDYDGEPFYVRNRRSVADSFFVNSKGKKILEGNVIEGIDCFRDGVVWGQFGKDYCLFDKEGEKLFTLKEDLDEIESYFSEGLCLAYRYLAEEGKANLYTIDKSGNINDLKLIVNKERGVNRKHSLEYYKNFENSLCFYKDDDKIVIFDKSGNIVLETTGYWADFLSKDRALISKKRDQRYDLVDLTNGNVLRSTESPPWYFNNFIALRNEIGWSLVDYNGKTIGLDFLKVKEVHEGCILVQDEKGWFFIDEDGKTTFKDKSLRFMNEPTDFHEGVSFVWITGEGKFYMINKEGEEVFKQD